MPVYGDGLNVRDWIHVARPLPGHRRGVWHDGRVGEVYNVGGRSERTNIELTTPCSTPSATRGRSSATSRTDPGTTAVMPSIAARSSASSAGSRRSRLRKGFADTVRWYREHQDWVANIRTGEYLKYYEKQYGRLAS